MSKKNANTIKISGASISWVKAKLRKEDRSGGAMPRLLMKPTSEQRDFFQSIEHWSVAISTSWGILPTRFWVRPRNYGTVGHNVFIRETSQFEERIIPPEICVNFDLRSTIPDVINHYCPEWDISRTAYRRVDQELQTDLFLVREPYSNRGLLILHNPADKRPLENLSITNSIQNSHLIESFFLHLARLRLYETVETFLKNWLFFIDKSISLSRDERDLEQKRDDLERLGFKCYFYRRQGIDSAATKVTLLRRNASPVEFNIDVESKFDAQNFFVKGEAGNSKKYPRLPIIVLCHADSSAEDSDQYFAHQVIGLRKVLSYLSESPLRMYPVTYSAKEEILRLEAIVAEENRILKREADDTLPIKRKKIKRTS
jgi:hypothetical protein